MHTHGRLTNGLLAIIALCLCLIVFDLYEVGPGARAQGEDRGAELTSVEVANTPLSVDVGNVPLPVELVVREPLRVQLYYDEGGTWRPVVLDAGALVVRPRR